MLERYKYYNAREIQNAHHKSTCSQSQEVWLDSSQLEGNEPQLRHVDQLSGQPVCSVVLLPSYSIAKELTIQPRNVFCCGCLGLQLHTSSAVSTHLHYKQVPNINEGAIITSICLSSLNSGNQNPFAALSAVVCYLVINVKIIL